jgi:hypothetical protein
MLTFILYQSGVEVIVTTPETEAAMLQSLGDRDLTEFVREEVTADGVAVRRPLGVEEWQAIKARCA